MIFKMNVSNGSEWSERLVSDNLNSYLQRITIPVILYL